MRLSIAIATTGRPKVVAQAVERLLRQIPQPHRIVVVGANPDDISSLDALRHPLLTAIIAPKGSCSQRNRALDVLDSTTELVAFLDDDYVPTADFTDAVIEFFEANQDVVVASGKLLADGILSPGLSFAEADALVANYVRGAVSQSAITDTSGAYGCNMVVRLDADHGVRFDEKLPLYGWQEDVDYANRLSPYGRVVQTDAFAGVHLGVKSGRTSGRRFGYSQVVNPIYLARKGTMPLPKAVGLISRNIVANISKSFWSEPYIDRRGRLIGNLRGAVDILTGTCDPERVLTL